MAVEADIKALDKRVKELEVLVKTLVAARTESKAEAAKMLAAVSSKIAAETREAYVTAMREGMKSPSKEEYLKLVREGEKAIEASLSTKMQTQAAADQAQRKQEAEKSAALLEKARADIDANLRNVMEARLRVFEGRLGGVENLAKAALATGAAAAKK